MTFRVGGNFFHPPPTLNRAECEAIDRVVFVAGGVGINPVMSMLSAMDESGVNRLGGMVKIVRVLYTSRRGESVETGKEEEILFERRLKTIAQKWKDHDHIDYKYTQFITSRTTRQDQTHADEANVATKYRRIHHDDLFEALGPEDTRANTVIYVCGLPNMTDEYVELLQKAPGMEVRRVLCEKWW